MVLARDAFRAGRSRKTDGILLGRIEANVDERIRESEEKQV